MKGYLNRILELSSIDVDKNLDEKQSNRSVIDHDLFNNIYERPRISTDSKESHSEVNDISKDFVDNQKKFDKPAEKRSRKGQSEIELNSEILADSNSKPKSDKSDTPSMRKLKNNQKDRSETKTKRFNTSDGLQANLIEQREKDHMVESKVNQLHPDTEDKPQKLIRVDTESSNQIQNNSLVPNPNKVIYRTDKIYSLNHLDETDSGAPIHIPVDLQTLKNPLSSQNEISVDIEQPPPLSRFLSSFSNVKLIAGERNESLMNNEGNWQKKAKGPDEINLTIGSIIMKIETVQEHDEYPVAIIREPKPSGSEINKTRLRRNYVR